MPWNEVSAMSLRNEFVYLATQEGTNFRALCRDFNIAPNTGYKWLGRYLAIGEAGLVERSRRPLTTPMRTPENLEQQIVTLREKHPAWGARKLKRRLEDLGFILPAVSTVHAVLLRTGLIFPRETQDKLATGRFEHPYPNSLWQMDFKGHVACGEGRCHPLTILDDHSRFSLCLQGCKNEQRKTVQEQLVSTFERYGVPERMTMDNGSPWGHEPGVWTALELWLMRQEIKVSHSRVSHPQTQGKDERFHRTLKAEVLRGKDFTTLSAMQEAFDIWRKIYNTERPHEGIGLSVPASRYRASMKPYTARPKPAEYDENKETRKVDISGRITLKGREYRVGKAFVKERLGIESEADDGIYSLWWYKTKIGVIDLKKRSITVGKHC
ncbi:IS481 family transposase [Brenneria goodwinii]|uniref:Mobile element protein n=1 Tax=Brenneria goodwinii TaxID=1109412 RepID=A0A0G4JW34_9GAMM|nr:IS481 family transposase [Brenneria goodwinii]CPR17359.1 Mobile element protein [Brenneria goodwinii]